MRLKDQRTGKWFKINYIEYQETKYGRYCWYRRNGVRLASLRLPLLSPEFWDDYRAAGAGLPVKATRRVKRAEARDGTFAAMVLKYQASRKWRELADKSNMTTAFERIVEKAGKLKGGYLGLGDATMKKADPDAIVTLVDNLIEECGAGVAINTADAFRLLYKCARLPSPLIGWEKPKLGVIHDWTDAEIDDYRRHWQYGTMARRALEALVHTSLRCCDAVHIGGLDPATGEPTITADGCVVIVQQKIKNKVGIERAKTKPIPIHPDLQRALDACPLMGIDGTWLLGARGGPFTAAGLSVQMRRWAHEAGLPSRCTAHGLRGAGMRQVVEHGGELIEAMAKSSHHSTPVALKYLRNRDDRAAAKAAVARVPVSTVA